MKAVILAGGKGTRARPFTDYFPKAMIPVLGSPLIDHVVRYLSSFKLSLRDNHSCRHRGPRRPDKELFRKRSQNKICPRFRKRYCGRLVTPRQNAWKGAVFLVVCRQHGGSQLGKNVRAFC
ncbi:nucleotidyltransferase family protein [Candidatus Nitrosotenuis chungbukensis]|uniref:nucleotidyltransferase family protein n=1 Tax=Candidatus Nitrosotenuis chungbukensis TaxID=1353246 RepID=UPI002A4E13FB|nr:sugar phosphate nucleotidyltransferase [Candidatus Nitrosotenuis chungbukensis]